MDKIASARINSFALVSLNTDLSESIHFRLNLFNEEVANLIKDNSNLKAIIQPVQNISVLDV